MLVKFKALHWNHTWHLVTPLYHGQIIEYKWVYKLKFKPGSTIDRYKSQFVAKRYHQTSGLDYFKTFSLVVRPTTIRIVLTLAISQKWCIKQHNIQNTFLHGELSEEVFMEQLPSLNFLTMCAKWIKHYMALSNHLVLGTRSSTTLYYYGVSKVLKLTPPCFSFTFLLMFFLFLSMLTMSSL